MTAQIIGAISAVLIALIGYLLQSERKKLKRAESKLRQALLDNLAFWRIEQYHCEGSGLSPGATAFKRQIRAELRAKGIMTPSGDANPQKIMDELRKLGIIIANPKPQERPAVKTPAGDREQLALMHTGGSWVDRAKIDDRPLSDLERKYAEALCNLLAFFAIETYHSEGTYLNNMRAPSAQSARMKVRELVFKQTGAMPTSLSAPAVICQELGRLGFRQDMKISGFIHDE
jgi:hypothetical protein